MASQFPTLELGVAFADNPGAASPTYTNIVGRLISFDTDRGRDDPLSTFGVGRATFLLDNSDRALDPNHSGSPYSPNVKPRKRVRFRATYAGDNLLTYSQSSVEDGVAGWGNTFATCTLASSTAQAADGAKSLAMTAAGGNMQCDTNVGTRPSVTVGLSYTAAVSFRTAATARSCRVNINWFDSGGTGLSATTGATVTDSTTAWTQATVTGTAPANAATACVTVEVLAAAASEAHYVDKAQLLQGTSTTWQPGHGTFDIFHGYADSWEQHYQHPEGATVTLRCSDAFKVFGYQHLPSVFEQTIRGHASLIRWYRLGEPETATEVVDSLGIGGPGQVLGDVDFEATGSVFGDDDTAVTIGRSADYIKFPPVLPTSGGWTMGFHILSDTNADVRVFSSRPYWDGTNRWEILLLGASSGGVYVDFGTGGTISGTATVRDGGWHYVMLIKSATDGRIRLYVDGTLNGTTASAVTVTSTPFNLGDPGGTVVPDYTIDEFTVYNAQLDALDATYTTVAATIPWQDDPEGTRVGRVLDAFDWPAGDRDIDTGVSVLTRADLSSSVLEHMQNVATSANARLFMSRDGKVTLISRHAMLAEHRYIASQATFGDQAGELPYVDMTIDPSIDNVINDARVTAQSGTPQVASDATSQDEHFTQSHEVSTLLRDDAEAKDYAAWLVARFKDSQQRISSLRLWPNHDEGRMWPEVLRRELADRVTVKRWPQGVGSVISQQAHVERIRHRGTKKEWSTELVLSPADTATYWILGDPVCGLLGSTTRLAF